MEEKKIVNKEAKLGVIKNPSMETEKPQKLSYEKLNQVCIEMSQQLQNQDKHIQQLRQQIGNMGYALQSKRLDYLFKVLEYQKEFKSDFVLSCCAEIEESLTIPQEEDKEDKVEE